jgi:trigger factor
MAKKDEITKKILITVKDEKWQKAIDKACEKNIKKAEVKGFRKGKVPKDVFIKKYGIESLYNDALDSVIDEAYKEAFEKVDSEKIAARPSVDVKAIDKDHVDLEFNFLYKPEVKIKKYKGFKIKKEKTEVTKEEVEHEISHILDRYSELVIKEGKVKNHDFVIIDFKGMKDKVAFPGGTAENYSLEVGSNSFIPGFEEELIGMKKGEEKTFPIKFPETYHEESLKGQEVEFYVKINEVKEKEVRKLDEELFKDLNIEGVTDEKSLKEHIEKELKAAKEKEADTKYMDELLKNIADNTEVEIPKEMIEEEKSRIFDSFENAIKAQGMDINMYMQLTGLTLEQMDKQLEPEANKNVLYRLMTEELEKELKITVSKEDIEARIKELAEKNHMTKEDLLYNFGGEKALEYETRVHKLFETLKDLNK